MTTMWWAMAFYETFMLAVCLSAAAKLPHRGARIGAVLMTVACAFGLVAVLTVIHGEVWPAR